MSLRLLEIQYDAWNFSLPMDITSSSLIDASIILRKDLSYDPFKILEEEKNRKAAEGNGTATTGSNYVLMSIRSIFRIEMILLCSS